MNAPAPTRTARATEVRSRRAELKRAMKANAAFAIRVLHGAEESWEPTAREVPLEALLLAVPGIGAHTADRILDSRGLRPRHTLVALTDERRREIAAEAARHAEDHA